ncbi:ATPase [Bacillus anthracis]|nr:ATPase [Bacillus anthracis]
MLKYGDLIKFEAVESVVQLKEANDTDYAISLLNTYVISDNMAEKLTNEIIENIQFDRWVDNKGMLIVGNYGTGKSHLMSVISTIAELPGASEHLRHKEVAEKAKEIEGKFQVVRAEFGAVTMPLRDIICRELERGLEKMGIDYTFPAADQVTNNKEMFYEMMELFHEQYPDKGLLLVIDELLDYLRGRKEQDLTLDLGFLREVGEVCGKSRFRFISGVQEMLFDNPKFSFVADSLRRVKERFKEARIVREDIAFVVSERLLKKNDEQKALVREHLSKFTKLYNGLAEDMETFVSMYPIHPSYLETFEKVNIAEKRVVLQTISKEIKKLLMLEVPEEATGLISFDRYWQYIEEDSSLRTNDNVKLVMNKVEMLKGCIQTGVKRQYKVMANQLVDALAVYRLTTDDLKTPIGLTSESLRDKLFISHPMLLELDEEASEFLTTMIEAAMKDLMTAASFQFVSLNKDNGQYYIDIAKVTAVDELIQQRGEGLTDNQLDSYYFQVLKQATEVTDTSYVSGYKIWLHEIPWIDRRVKREGYIFFGAPNERSTAQPERDFYIYMLQPFEEPKFKDEQKEDEVFFRLIKKNDDFVNLLRLYSGSCEMYKDTTTNRHLYKPKMDDYLKKLVKWLKENFVEAFEIVYRGKHADVLEHGFFLPSNPDTLIQIIDSVSQDLLSQWFEVKYSEYPTFRKLDKSFVTKSNMQTYVKDALDYLNGKKTNQGEAILNGLVLLDNNGNLTARNSGYAKWVLELLNQKEPGQVLNQNELIEVINTVQGTPDQRLTKQFAMEPELLAVVLASLIQSGEIVVTVNGTTYEAMNFAEFVRLPINDLTYFSHIKRPSGLPVPAVQALIAMFGGEQIDFTNLDAVDFSIKRIISRAKEETNKTVEMVANIRNRFVIWDGQLFSLEEKEEKITKLNSLNEFLQGLQIYNTRAKMVNLKYDINRIEEEKKNLAIVHGLEKLQHKINEYTKVADYLTKARYIVSPSQEWIDAVDVSLGNLSIILKNGEDCSREVAELERLKKEYIEHYMVLHQTARLNATENKKKSELLKDPRYDALNTLASKISFLPHQAFDDWQMSLKTLKDCYNLTVEKLQHMPECPNCRFNPREEQNKAKPSLAQLEDQLGELLNSWTETLLTNFNDSIVKESIDLLESEQKCLMNELIENQAFTMPISLNLINAINVILKGIHKEQIEMGQLLKVFGDGNPITVDEARKNFDMLLKGLIGTNEPNRIRLTVKK